MRAVNDKDIILAKIDELALLLSQLDSSDKAHMLSVPPVYLTHSFLKDAIFKLDVVSNTID